MNFLKRKTKKEATVNMDGLTIVQNIEDQEDVTDNFIRIGDYHGDRNPIGTSKFIDLEKDFPLAVTSFESWKSFTIMQTVLDHCIDSGSWDIYVTSFQHTFENYANNDSIKALVNTMFQKDYEKLYHDVILPLSDELEKRRAMPEGELGVSKPILLIVEDAIMFNRFGHDSSYGPNAVETRKTMQIMEDVFNNGNALNIKVMMGVGVGWSDWNHEKESFFRKINDSLKSHVIFPYKISYLDLFGLLDHHERKFLNDSCIDKILQLRFPQSIYNVRVFTEYNEEPERKFQERPSCATIMRFYGYEQTNVFVEKNVDVSMRMIPG